MPGAKGRPKRIALPWFNADHYPALQHACPFLPPTWSAWRKAARAVENAAAAQGVPVARVHIDPKTIAALCLRRGRALTSKALLAWAARQRERPAMDVQERLRLELAKTLAAERKAASVRRG